MRTVLELLKKYEPTLRDMSKSLMTALEPFYDTVRELYISLEGTYDELHKTVMQYIEKLPSFETLEQDVKQWLESLVIADDVLEVVNGLFDYLKMLPVNPETQELFDRLQDYLTAKIKYYYQQQQQQQQAAPNDERYLNEIGQQLSKVLHSLLLQVNQMILAPHETNSFLRRLHQLWTMPSMTVEFLTNLPNMLTMRFSLLNFLKNENWSQNLLSLQYWRTLILYQGFQLHGHIIDGRHLMTFDDVYLTMAGNCKYVLAQDSVNNNFTVIGHLTNGKLKTVTLVDRDGQFMEINENGALKFNDKPMEYPVHENGMHAWRNYYTLWLHSTYGATVMCSTDLKLCHVMVNGFYTSKTRGLLGNGNAEPYDDLLQIDGTLADNANTFVNGYTVGKCNPVTNAEMSNEQLKTTAANTQPMDAATDALPEVCQELFGLRSTLAFGYGFVNPEPYRKGCEQSVKQVTAPNDKEKELNAACLVASGYASALKLRDIFVLLPPQCLKCSGAVGQRELSEEFSVKVPNNKADVVVTVDFDVSETMMNNLLTPLLNELRDGFKARGFSDVQMTVIGHSEHQRYPSMFTSDNGKLNFHRNLADIKLNGPKPLLDADISRIMGDRNVPAFVEILETVLKHLLPTSTDRAMKLALNYPFRAAAAKSIIVIRNEAQHENLVITIISTFF